MEIIYNFRNIENKDWATILFLITFVLIVYTKTNFNQQFSVFLNLIFSDKYLKLYNKKENILSTFNLNLFIIQIISFSFFIMLIFNHYNLCSKYNGIVFLQIITTLFVTTLTKFIIDKIISIIFEIEKETAIFNHFRLSYRSLFFLYLLPILAIFYYNEVPNFMIVFFVLLLIVYNTVTYINILNVFKTKLISNLFYFILYLCTLEIAPYYFIYYWIKNN